jgi:cytochrome bd-type quinol oxidase subunit 2
LDLFRTLVALVMLGIVFSLGSALFHLMTDKGDSKKMVRALTMRVALSVTLFLALMVGVRPHPAARRPPLIGLPPLPSRRMPRRRAQGK